MKFPFCKLCLISLVLLASCASDGSKNKNNPLNKNQRLSPQALRENIKEMEDSLAKFNATNVSPAAQNLSRIELINRLDLYYKSYPKDPFSAECLFKIHMLYSEMKAHEKSNAYGDSLLKAFPNNANRMLLLESMISSCDMDIKPRDTSLIRKYCKMLLLDANYPELKKQEIRERLKFIQLSFQDYAAKRNNLNMQ
jgi:hypothetical protein